MVFCYYNANEETQVLHRHISFGGPLRYGGAKPGKDCGEASAVDQRQVPEEVTGDGEVEI